MPNTSQTIADRRRRRIRKKKEEMELWLSTLISATLVVLLVHLLRSFRHRSRLPLPPGPKGWPILGNLPQLGLKPHHTLADLARSYGPLLHLRMGSVHVIVVASSSVAAQFLKRHDANFSSRPPNSGAKHIAYNYNDLVFAPYGPRWRTLRKVCAIHLFSAKALDDFRHVREGEVARLAARLFAQPPSAQEVQIGELLNICTTNALARALIGRRVFGEEATGAHKETAGEFKEMVVELMVLAGVFNLGDFIPALDWMDLQGVARKMKKLHRKFDAFLAKILEEHRQEAATGTHRDLLSVLMALKLEDGEGDDGKLTETELKALLLGKNFGYVSLFEFLLFTGAAGQGKIKEAGMNGRPRAFMATMPFKCLLNEGCVHWMKWDVTNEEIDFTCISASQVPPTAIERNFFTAGTDTSSSTVEWALAELIRYPKILAQAQKELDSVVGPDRLVSDADLAQLPYLQAIIKETFRLHPSTPLSLPRVAAEDSEINGYFIPKNSTLLVNVWAISRDPAVWPDPLEFRPERFLPGSPQAHIDIRGADFEVIPFGAGRRICAGMSLGLRMVQFMTATLIHAFNWALPQGQFPEKLDMEEAYGLTLQRAVPLRLQPKPRLPAHVYAASQSN
ncbi:cytochrome P450 [Asimina triloba]